MKTKTHYTTIGSVRGRCAHAHRSLATAIQCLERDRTACASLGDGSYSDRRVYSVAPNGETYLELS